MLASVEFIRSFELSNGVIRVSRVSFGCALHVVDVHATHEIWATEVLRTYGSRVSRIVKATARRLAAG